MNVNYLIIKRIQQNIKEIVFLPSNIIRNKKFETLSVYKFYLNYIKDINNCPKSNKNNNNIIENSFTDNNINNVNIRNNYGINTPDIKKGSFSSKTSYILTSDNNKNQSYFSVLRIPGKDKLKKLFQDDIINDDNILDYEINEDLSLTTKPIYYVLLKYFRKLSKVNYIIHFSGY